MKVGVLGATGMLGHHTARALQAAGHDVVVLHRQGSALDKLSDLTFEPRQADLAASADALTAALQGLDGIVHCAAYYPTRPQPWQADVEAGIAQERRFYQACEQASLSRIVYVGGSIALRQHPQGEPGNETLSYASQPPGRNPYVQVKWAMDHLALEMAKKGLPVSVAIPSMTFGEFDYGPSTGQFITEIANQRLPAYVDGRRNVIYAGDAGRGIARVLEQGRSGQRYLLTGENITMADLANLIARTAGVTAPKQAPLWVAKTLARIQALKYHYLNGPVPKISDTAIAVMSSGQFLDGSKARDELGFVAEVTAEQAVQRAYQWFRDVGYVGG